MTRETIELTAADGHRLAAYRVRPDGRAKGAVVIAQEIFGVNSHIRSIVDDYAANGYLAIAPALFDRHERGIEYGYKPEDIAAGREVIGKLSWENTMKDVAAAVEHARAAGRIAVIGYCWGGTIAWLASSRLPGIACTVAYYGGGIPDFIDEAPQRPIQLHFGEQDTRPSPADARVISDRYPDAKAFNYPAGHGFNCDQRGSYDATSAALARERTLAFLGEHLSV